MDFGVGAAYVYVMKCGRQPLQPQAGNEALQAGQQTNHLEDMVVDMVVDHQVARLLGDN
jgi:hypothetical protein